MDKQMFETSTNQQLSSENEMEDVWTHLFQENVKEPSIPLAIALIVAILWLGIILATHWPFKIF
jgi:hypothetical protein